MRNSDNGLELKLNLFKISQKVKFLSSKVISLSSTPKPPQFNTPLSSTPKTPPVQSQFIESLYRAIL